MSQRLSTAYHLTVRRQDRGGDVAATVADHDSLATSDRRHILMFIHGFNNTRAQAEEGYDNLADLLRAKLSDSRIGPDAIAYFQWPGDIAVGPASIMDFAAYHQDITQAKTSAQRLLTYIVDHLLANGPPSRQLAIIGHSLGCRLIDEMLRSLAPHLVQRISVISLMAAALPTELVGLGAPPPIPIWPAPWHVIKCSSESDLVLRVGFPVGQFLAYITGIEPHDYDEAVGLHGNPRNFATPVQTQNGHGDYWTDKLAANVFFKAIDPTILPFPVSTDLPSRALAPQITLPARNIPSRTLPNR